MIPAALPSACPDCAGPLHEITLFARSAENPISGAAIDTAVVYYTGAEATRSTWLSMFQVRGEVRTLMCGKCARIFLYGVPDERA
jgi:hypothetical protein